MKNIFLKTLIRLAQRWISKNKQKDRILVVSTTAFGDTLWATPAIESIKKNLPNCYLAVLTSQIGIDVLQQNPHIDRFFLLKEPLSRSFFSLWRDLYKEKFDTVLLFHASQRLTLPLCSLLGARRIVGTAGINKGLDCLLTHPLPNHPQHEIVRRLKIIETIGIAPTTEKLSFFLNETLPPRSKGPWIAFHPGSKDPFKRWPKEKFIELGNLLKKEMDCEILITGTEKELIRAIATAIPEVHVDESKDLKTLALVLNQMDLLISNDTGPVHLACALDRPVIAIYASTDPLFCGPYKAEKAKVIFRKACCDPCLKRKCKLPFCFWQIGVDEIYAEIGSIFQRQ